MATMINSLQILVYHQVKYASDGVFPPLHPSVFTAQMRHISRWYRIITAGQAAHKLREGRVPNRPICVTFDDGYRDVCEIAYKILRQFKIPCTIFLSTGPIETGEPLWHDKMFTAFARTRNTFWGFNGLGYNLQQQPERVRAAERFASYLRTLGETERDDAVESLCRELKVDPGEAAERSPMLTWEQITEMAERGIEIGSHTITHPILSRLPRQRQEQEIMGCVATIEKRLGTRPKVFAYPNGKEGDFTESTVDLLKQADIEAAFTTRFGVNTKNSDPYRLRRGAAWADSRVRFAAQMIWYRLEGSLLR